MMQGGAFINKKQPFFSFSSLEVFGAPLPTVTYDTASTEQASEAPSPSTGQRSTPGTEHLGCGSLNAQRGLTSVPDTFLGRSPTSVSLRPPPQGSSMCVCVCPHSVQLPGHLTSSLFAPYSRSARDLSSVGHRTSRPVNRATRVQCRGSRDTASVFRLFGHFKNH